MGNNRQTPLGRQVSDAIRERSKEERERTYAENVTPAVELAHAIARTVVPGQVSISGGNSAAVILVREEWARIVRALEVRAVPDGEELEAADALILKLRSVLPRGWPL
jgi:hypothetical protein